MIIDNPLLRAENIGRAGLKFEISVAKLQNFSIQWVVDIIFRTSSPPIYANPGDNSVSLMNDNEIHCGGSPVGSVPNIAMELIACGWKNFQSEDYPPSTFSPPNVSGQRFIRNIKLTVTL